MIASITLISALLLSPERICYAWIWLRPDSFRLLCSSPAVASLGEPVDVLQNLFLFFKLVQVSVFVSWCVVLGDGEFPLPGDDLWSIACGAMLMVAGQALNLSVFYRLGKHGVFYGNKLGYPIPWCSKFPFSIISHPQYLGTLLSIWGFFLVMRYPHSDWFILPMIESVLYAWGAYVER